MIWFFIFLVVPTIWVLYAGFFIKSFTWKEAAIQFGVSLGFCGFLAFLSILSKYTSAMDVEILNGRVVDKFPQRVSCIHQEECNCRMNDEGRRVCEMCDIHPFDIDWVVRTTVGDVNIDRINEQGTIQPPRFGSVIVGEPASLENRYINYVKAVPESIFNTNDFEVTHNTPRYPRVHDYYRVRHVLDANSGVPRSTLDDWDASLKQRLMVLGHSHQVNIMVVVTGNSPSYAKDLEYNWLRGKKNDVVVVLGVDEAGGIVKWVDSFGWSKSSRVFYEMESNLINVEINENVIDIIGDTVVEYYERQPFEEYSYLIDEVSTPWWAILLLFIGNIIVTVVIGRRFTQTPN